jgi:hypothetical protein
VFSALASAAVAGAVQTVPDPDRVSPGFAGFSVMFVLAVATILLIRSMTKHMRKVRYLPLPPEVGSGPQQRQRAGDVVDDQRVDTSRE